MAVYWFCPISQSNCFSARGWSPRIPAPNYSIFRASETERSKDTQQPKPFLCASKVTKRTELEMDDQSKFSLIENEEGGKQYMEGNKAVTPLQIDEVLPLIGGFGRFQKIIVLFMSVIRFPTATLVLIPYFVQDNPKWKCVENSTVCLLNGTFGRESRLYKERCSMSRSHWMFTKPKDYSIVTQVRMFFFSSVQRAGASVSS